MKSCIYCLRVLNKRAKQRVTNYCRESLNKFAEHAVKLKKVFVTLCGGSSVKVTFSVSLT